MRLTGRLAERRGWLRAVLALAVLAATAATWRCALDGASFMLDDRHYFVANPFYRGLERENLEWMASSGWMGHYQPLTWLTLALDWERGGLDPRAYHETSLAVHLAAALALFWLAREVLLAAAARSGRGAGAALEVAAAAAALAFALHPLRAEPVAWATGRNDLLAGLFAILAAAVWMRRGRAVAAPQVGRRAALEVLGACALFLALFELSVDLSGRWGRDVLGWGPLGSAGLLAGAAALGFAAWRAAGGERRGTYLVSCALYALSLSAKAWAMPLAFALLVADVWPLGRLTARGRGALLEKAPWIALALAFARLTAWAKAGTDDVPLSFSEHTLSERVAQAFYGLAYYPLKTLWPTGLVAIRDVPDRVPLFEGVYLLSAIAVLGLAGWLWTERARARGAIAALAAYAVLVAPVLGLVQFGGQLAADRYAYLAGVPLALLAGGAWLALWRRPRGRWAAAAALLVLLPLARAASAQARTWSDGETLYAHNLRHAPSARAMANLALEYNDRAEREPARRAELLARAVVLAERALALSAGERRYRAEYRLYLGTVLYNLGRNDEALAQLEAFVREKPDSAEGHWNLALALERAGRAGEAARERAHAARSAR